MISRRCAHRRFLLRPSKEVDQAFLYCFAVAARRHDIDVYWLMVMSNHYHAGIHDPHGRYPEFIRYLHSLVARCLNCHYGRWENFWSTEQTGALHLADAKAVFEKQIYSLCNAVKDHLVDRAHVWPGFCSYSYQLADKPVVVRRPHWFFSELGDMPDEAELRFLQPREFAHLSKQEWLEKLRSAVEAEESKAAQARKIDGLSIVGCKALRRQSPFSHPKTCVDRRVLRPRVATKNKWLRIEMLSRNKRFQQRYRDAFLRRRAGKVDVLFPYGSYQLRVLGLVRCEPPPPG